MNAENRESGLSIAQQAPADVDVRIVETPHTATGIWQTLTDPWRDNGSLAGHLVTSARVTAIGRTRGEYLDELPFDTDGLLGVIFDRLTDGTDDDRFWSALDALQNLGQGKPLGAPTSMEDIDDALSLLTERDIVPSVAIHLGRDWFDECTDRDAWLSFVCELACVCDVTLICSRVVHHKLWVDYRHQLPASVSDGVNPRLIDGVCAGDVAKAVEEAHDELNQDSRHVRILRSIADENSETLTYNALYGMNSGVDKSAVRQCLSKLAGLGLVEKFGPRTRKAVSLLPAGRQFLDVLETETARQRRLDGFVSETGKSPGNSRVNTRTHGEGEDGPGDGLYGIAELRRSEHAAATTAPPENGLVTVDRTIEQRENAKEAGWFHDPQDETLTVSAEPTSPLQLWVCIARALTHWRTWSYALTPERLESEDYDFIGLFEECRGYLRDARCLGELSDEIQSAEEFVDALEAAREDVKEMTGRMQRGEYNNRNGLRSEITRAALGLYGTLIHLCDMVGIDVTLEIRLPDYRANLKEAQVDALITSIAKGVAIGSKYGEHAAYRQLFEPRDEKREQIIEPVVDANDPVGTFVGNIVVTGKNVSALVPKLETALSEPAELQDDAPEFSVDIPITDRPAGRAYRHAIERIADRKNLEPGRDCVAVLRALSGSLYDATRAIEDGLKPEPYPRNMRLDEVRTALARGLSPEHLVTGIKPTERQMVHALLDAADPLSQTALADRADCSPRSVRNNIETLLALDLVRETDDGYRLSLAFATTDERHETVLPWYATPNSERDDYRDATLGGIVLEALEALNPPDSDAIVTALSWPLDTADVADALPDVGRWLAVLEALAADQRNRVTSTTVSFGHEPVQTDIQHSGPTAAQVP